MTGASLRTLILPISARPDEHFALGIRLAFTSLRLIAAGKKNQSSRWIGVIDET
jgi:hypothetical protein